MFTMGFVDSVSTRTPRLVLQLKVGLNYMKTKKENIQLRLRLLLTEPYVRRVRKILIYENFKLLWSAPVLTGIQNPCLRFGRTSCAGFNFSE